MDKRAEVVGQVAREAGMDAAAGGSKTVAAVLTALGRHVTREAKAGRNVRLPGVGVFQTYVRMVSVPTLPRSQPFRQLRFTPEPRVRRMIQSHGETP